MKKLLLFLIAIVIVVGCAKDIIVPPSSDIRGSYTGTYESVTNYKVPGTISRIQDVKWTFSDTRFWCDYDSSSIARVFCDFLGNYTLGTQVITFTDTLVEEQICTHSDIPIGEFTMGSRGDTLRIAQWDIPKNTFKVLMLLKE